MVNLGVKGERTRNWVVEGTEEGDIINTEVEEEADAYQDIIREDGKRGE